MDINKDILKRVEEEEEGVRKKREEAAYIERCVAVRICPQCGNDLECELFDDGGKRYTCPKCKSTYYR